MGFVVGLCSDPRRKIRHTVLSQAHNWIKGKDKKRWEGTTRGSGRKMEGVRRGESRREWKF